MNIVLFEDNLVDRLYPITLSRPAWEITCGAWRLMDLVLTATQQRRVFRATRPLLQEFQPPFTSLDNLNRTRKTLWINARLVPETKLVQQIRDLLETERPVRRMVDDQVALALTAPGFTGDPSSAGADDDVTPLDATLFQAPHEVVLWHTEIMQDQLPFVLQQANYREIRDGVFAQGDITIHAPVAFDTTAGPIVLEPGATLDAFAVLKGPLRIGAGAYVAPHALLKGPITIGEHCKVGGEVSKSVMEAYSNKVHDGYLGSSYIGSWVNLGAGTCNSNLKNTYGTVRVEYEYGKVDTGMQFFGCIIGDYSKTAIQTSIYTGKMIGVCSNIYGMVTTNVPSFANYARSFGEITEHPVDVMEATQERMFQRRGVQQSEAHRRLLQAMYEIESPKRELANQPPSL